MRALSIRQPWAWAIAAGYKLVENRTWNTSFRGPLAIHAARMIETGAFDEVTRRAGRYPPQAGDLATGAVIAVCCLADVVERSSDQWFVGPYGFVLADVRPIVPVPCIGRQSLFTLPDDVEQVVSEQLRKRAHAH